MSTPHGSCGCEVHDDSISYRFTCCVTGLNTCTVCRFKDTMVNTVGHRTTEMALELGLLYNSSEALKIGLVDKLVPEDQVLTTATQTMTKWLAIPGIYPR